MFVTKIRTLILGAVAALLLPISALGQNSSPAGLWKNIDDATGKPRAVIRINETNGVLEGRIERVFPAPGETPDPTCTKCAGANRNAPVVGLVILSGLRKEADEYVDGRILDPDNGKTYRSKVKLVEDGQRLNVRGYIGIAAFGRTQTWVREK